VYVTDSTGRRSRRTLYGATRTAVEDKLATLLEAQARLEPIAPTELNVTTYLREWLQTLVRPRVRPTTFANYEWYVEKYLVPDLGSKPLGNLSARQVRMYLDSLRHRGVGDRSVQYVHATLKTALEDAVREELIPRNVAKLVRVRRPAKREIEPLSVDEVRSLLAHHREDRLLPMLVVIALLGLRRSEVLGLKWSDVDLDQGLLRVVRGVQRVNGELVELPTKTERSRRTVPLPGIVIDVLRNHQKAQEVDRANLAGRWPKTDYVFTSSVGTAIDPRNCTRLVQNACRNAGVRVVRLHDFRHGCISVLLALGVPPRTAMEIVGHTTLEMTMNVYGHVNHESKRQAMDQLGGLFADEEEAK
jgi:integrase